MCLWENEVFLRSTFAIEFESVRRGTFDKIEKFWKYQRQWNSNKAIDNASTSSNPDVVSPIRQIFAPSRQQRVHSLSKTMTRDKSLVTVTIRLWISAFQTLCLSTLPKYGTIHTNFNPCGNLFIPKWVHIWLTITGTQKKICQLNPEIREFLIRKVFRTLQLLKYSCVQNSKTFKQMAMKWVREYIYYFGGDANRVTIGGMSAGGQSIQVHLMAPSSWPFFNRAISISGPTGVPLKNAEESGNCSRSSEHRKQFGWPWQIKSFILRKYCKLSWLLFRKNSYSWKMSNF